MECKQTRIGNFKGIEIKNGNFILRIPTEIGPRILHFSLLDEYNIFEILDSTIGIQTQEGFWKLYGGHRLWSAPEAKPRSYSLDDKPINIEVKEEEIKIIGNPEEKNSIQKEVILRFEKNYIEVNHIIRNIGRWPIEVACWALSIMKRNGWAILPFFPMPVDKESLLPDRKLIIWPYTSLNDQRIMFMENYIIIKQDPNKQSPVKLGISANPSWCAYFIEGHLFIKRFENKKQEIYPDYGCNVETYTNHLMLELETLGTLKKVSPQETIVHKEYWYLQKIDILEINQENIEKIHSSIKKILS